MRNSYKFLYISIILFSSIILAADVTFRVDMTLTMASTDGVYVVGASPELAGPDGHLMSDSDGDDIWEITLPLPAGVYIYKFRNGYCDNWDNCSAVFEGSLQDCGVGDWDDREVTVASNDLVLDLYCFNSCEIGECGDPPDTFPVTFMVDMGIIGPNPSGVFVTGGSIPMAGPLGHEMSDSDGDLIYEVTVDLPPGIYTFKFRNGYCDNWNSCPQEFWEDFEGECGVGVWGDREITVTNQGFTYGPYCFDFCNSGECMIDVPVDVEFQVQLTDEQIEDASQCGGVYIYGNFNNFDLWVDPLQMDPIGNNTYSFTETFTSDDYLLYKYSICSGSAQMPESDDGVGGCGTDFGGDCSSNATNWRHQTVPYEDLIFNMDYYEECYDYTRVELNVDMSLEAVNSTGVYIAGGTMPNGSVGTEMCDPDGDNIYSTTMSFPINSHQTYKFGNGLCNDFDSCETFEDLCGCDDNECNANTNDWNDRYFYVSGEDNQIESAIIFGDCSEWVGYDDGNGDDDGGDDGGSSGTYNVNFMLDGIDDCEFVSITGTFDDWSGWGVAYSDGVTSIDLDDGEYEFIILCAHGDEWWNDIWGSSTILQPAIGSECDFMSGDEYANYGFIVNGSAIDISLCAGTCDEVCDGSGDDGGSSDMYSANFALDGIDACDWTSVTGTFDNWSGWGVAYGDGVTSISGLEDGSIHEFLVLCAQGDGWWYDIWASSDFLQPPLGSECDYFPEDEYANYGFIVSGTDIDVSICAGTCDEICLECTPGDTNNDQGIDVLDVVFLVNVIVGNTTPDDQELCAGDFNQDGGVDVLDIVAIVNIILG